MAAASSLPVIDIDALAGNNVSARYAVAMRLGEACENIGFAYVEGHGISQDLIDDVYREAATWFARPLEQKLLYYIGNSDNHRGYVPQSERGQYADEGERLYEAFDLALDLPCSDPDVQRGCYLLGPNVWPKEQPTFSTAVSRYYRDISAVGAAVTSAFELYLDLPAGHMGKQMSKPTSQLRLLHYLKHDSENGSAKMGAHTDYECFTLLHQTAPGLQVLNQHNRWIDAPPLPGTLVLNVGDLLETWSNGRLRSTLHRVINNGAERFSLPFFAAANYDAVIRPEVLPAGEGGQDYVPVVAGHHLLGQLLRDFPYLRTKHCRGELELPFAVPGVNRFEQEKMISAAA